MKRWLWVTGLLVVGAAGVYWVSRKAAPAETPFGKAKRETLVSQVTTNGKTEPVEWAPVHASKGGRISRLLVTKGQVVAAGSPLVQLEDRESQSAIAAGQARLEQAKADVVNLEHGGRAAELAELDGMVKRLRVERVALVREVGALERLVEKKAAAKMELDSARDRVAQTDAQIAATESKRASLVGQGDLNAARARVRDSEAALAQAKQDAELRVVKAPRGGVVYDLPAREGAWVEPGELIARIGEMSRLRVIVYVDEPDLGRIRKGLPVTVTWDAMQGKEWQGVVDQVPSQVVALNSRQVGEVVTVAGNPQGDLMPGANINARIRAQVVEGALTIPKAALRRENGELGVYVLENGKLAWRVIRIGVSSETRAEVVSGLKEGDSVALPTDRTLSAGLEVAPVYP